MAENSGWDQNSRRIAEALKFGKVVVVVSGVAVKARLSSQDRLFLLIAGPGRQSQGGLWARRRGQRSAWPAASPTQRGPPLRAAAIMGVYVVHILPPTPIP